ncbi:DsbA family oxidoreductase [Burkholderia sp. SRS-46]|nr:DsbA family oxidoreductase [Burkholderia sp. SRS-46]
MKIDIWSDVICPFCYIGKRKLEAALEQTGLHVEIEWHSFELNPSAPQSYGVPLPDVMNALYGMSPERAVAVLDHEAHEASLVGLDFLWRIAKPGNTFNAHRVLHLAKHVGLGDQTKERFLRAYFTEGKDIGEVQVIRALALEVGLTAEDVDAVLSTDRFAAEVRADEQQAARLGIRGVPHFVIDGQATISGARDVSDFVRVLQARQDAADDAAPDAGAVCKDGDCQVAR